ncbi:ABC transporter ATP-binding protein [Micromonospora sp. NPDC003197]
MKVEVSELNRFYRVRRAREGARGLGRLLRQQVEVIHAVRDVSFTIDDGMALGYIGMNGAGKSTTLKMLAGVLAPSSGTVRLDGRDPMRHRRELASRIGFLAPLKGHLWWDLPAMDTFQLVAKMYGLAEKPFRADLDRLTADLEFTELTTLPVRQLSTGNRVKAELICTLLPRPDLIILDEPTIGLDLLAKEAIHRVLRATKIEAGTTLVVTSHDLRDVDALCDEVIVIDKGSVIVQGAIGDIQKQWGTSRQIHVEYSAPVPELSFDELTLLTVDSRSVTYGFDSDQFPVEAVRRLLADPTVIDVRVDSVDLATVVREIYSGRPAGRS